MSSELVPLQSELVPSQRGVLSISTAATAGKCALQPTAALEIIVPETVEEIENSATDAPIAIPAQGSPLQDNLSAEALLAETVLPGESTNDSLADIEEELAPTAPNQEGALDTWNTLVVRAQEGDTDAFAQLYRRYHDTVFRFVYFRVSNRQVAEDLASETFFRALKRIGGITWQGKDIGAWFVTIARNLMADYFKSGRYRFEVVTGDVCENDGADPHTDVNPEDAVLEYITNTDLLNAVKQLNPEQRQCIELRFLHGHSVAETAQAMGKNEGAIKALQYRAVRTLKRLLPEGFEP